MGEVIAFILCAVFGVLSTCLIAAGRRDDDVQNMITGSDADGQKDS